MRREVDINDITDGNKYKSTDMVKVSCNDCRGCSKCCRDMGKSIILDPYDIYQLTKGLGLSFDELLTGEGTVDSLAEEGNEGPDDKSGVEPMIELSMVDGLMLPNILMDNKRKACSMLSEEGRCRIHEFRPGLCRLFPLGRLYEDGAFSYINQIYECDYANKSKVKIKKWLGIDNLAAYEKFVLKWHDFLEEVRQVADNAEDTDTVRAIMFGFIKRFFRDPYDTDRSFYEQIEERFNA